MRCLISLFRKRRLAHATLAKAIAPHHVSPNDGHDCEPQAFWPAWAISHNPE